MIVAEIISKTEKRRQMFSSFFFSSVMVVYDDEYSNARDIILFFQIEFLQIRHTNYITFTTNNST